MPEESTSTPRRDRPLAGRTIVVTRAAEQAAGLAGPLADAGAEVLLLPVIEIVPPTSWAAADTAIAAIDTYDWIVLTSTNGIEALAHRLTHHGLRLGDLATKRIAVVGSATATRLREYGLEPALQPDEFRAEGLVAAFGAAGTRGGRRVLIARAEEAREVLPDDLRTLGFEVTVAPVYRLASAEPPVEVLDRLRGGSVDAVTFASGGTARRFAYALAAAGLDAASVLVAPLTASIGPVTTAALRDLGIAVDVEAAEATSASLVEALVARLAGGAR